MAGEKKFAISGKFTEKGREKKFSDSISAISENMAVEKIMCLLGSKHKIKRRHIFVEEVKELNE